MKICFIGLGKMGSAIVRRLLEQGISPTVYNRTASKADPLVELGAIRAESIASAVKDADLIFTSLLNDKATLEVSEQVIPHMKKEAIAVGLSTILPATSDTLCDKHNGNFVAATVLGVPHVALAGELTTFCCGDEKLAKRVEESLKIFSKKVIYLGPNIRAANVMKICMNYSLITAIELISELYVFAEKSGLDREVVSLGLHEVYGHPAFKLYVDKIGARDFDDVNFDVIGGNKDTHLFQEAFADVGVSPEIGNIVRSRFIAALSKGMEKKDWSSIYEIIRSEAGLS
ncbi:MAG: 3-sulfolactaldehyde reductase [Chlamydiales bacterium]|nr:3-sulfolactaldehyde reductase [Chlamydiales bacterium]MCH9635626.1 3-sulfolactaldehyde reductase [Chlamydiales bacterium]MCH9703295.1 NAD(P)-dependent oxidoreductase [Chlamydiota bacterium]